MAKLPDGMKVETVNGYQTITFKMEPNAITATDAKPLSDGIVIHGWDVDDDRYWGASPLREMYRPTPGDVRYTSHVREADGKVTLKWTHMGAEYSYTSTSESINRESAKMRGLPDPPPATDAAPSIHYTRHHVDPSGTVRLEWMRDGKQFGLTFRDEDQRKWWIYHYGQEHGNLPEPTRDTPNPEPPPATDAAPAFRYTRHHVNADGTVIIAWRTKSGFDFDYMWGSESARDADFNRPGNSWQRPIPEPTRDTPKPAPSNVHRELSGSIIDAPAIRNGRAYFHVMTSHGTYCFVKQHDADKSTYGPECIGMLLIFADSDIVAMIPPLDAPKPHTHDGEDARLLECDLRDPFGIRCARPLGHAHECRTPFGHRFNVPADAPSPNAVTMGGVTLELPTEADAAARKEAMRDREWEMSRGTSADTATAMARAPGWVRSSQSVRVAWDSLDSRIAESKRERAK